MSATSLAHKTFHVITYGCQMNKHDSERIVGMLTSWGAEEVPTIEDAEIVVFMTCCVREAADIRLKGQVASLKNIPLPANSTLKKRIVAIGGCIGQRDREKLETELPHVDIVFGTFNLGDLPNLVNQIITEGGQRVSVLESAETFPTELPTKREHSWAAWVPISIGCNNFCTYCIVPYVRGREKSRTIEDIVLDVRNLIADGVKEITLLGQNVNSYGRDLYGSPRFAKLLNTIADLGIDRIRFATSHPKDLNDEVIRAFAELPNVMPALHLPVQSGSNSILKAMNRRYTRQHYLEIVSKLREARSDIALSTDVIVGFPGETEADFKDTYSLIDEVGYNQVFTFIYSKREGTPAAKMVDSIPHEVIQSRFDSLVTLVQKRAYEMNQRYNNETMEVLFESLSKRNKSILTGKSPHNITVHVPLPDGKQLYDFEGKILPVNITEAKTWYLKGSFINE